MTSRELTYSEMKQRGLRNRVAMRAELYPKEHRERFQALVLAPPTIVAQGGLQRDTSDRSKALFWEGYEFGPNTMKASEPLYAIYMAGRFRRSLERYGHLKPVIREQARAET